MQDTNFVEIVVYFLSNQFNDQCNNQFNDQFNDPFGYKCTIILDFYNLGVFRHWITQYHKYHR